MSSGLGRHQRPGRSPARRKAGRAGPASRRGGSSKPAKRAKTTTPGRSAKSGQREAARNARARRKVESGRPGGPRKPTVGRRRARAALVLGVSVVLVGFLFAFYFPTRTWLAQRRSTRNATTQLDALTSANQTLSAQASALKDPAAIARIARDQYGMVKPGEKAFIVLPPPSAPTALPKVWPFEQSVTPTGPNASQGQVAAGSDSGPPAAG